MEETDEILLWRDGGQIMTFTDSTTIFAFDIRIITDIIEVPEITPLPKVPPYILGVINLRGKVVPVMDFKYRTQKTFTDFDDKTCIIVIEAEKSSIGIIVERVMDVETCIAEQFAKSPVENSIVDYYINMDEKRISLLNHLKLITDDLTT